MNQPSSSRHFRVKLLFATIVTVGLAVDLGTKEWIFRRLGMPAWDAAPIWVVPNVFSLTTSLNEGALWGMGQQMTPYFACVSIVAALGILFAVLGRGMADTPLTATAFGMILAGILGNLYDRLGLPGLRWNYPADRVGQPVFAVRDWLHFKLEGIIDWPVFNIADSLLVCGAAFIVLYSLITPAHAPTVAKEPDAPRTGVV